MRQPSASEYYSRMSERETIRITVNGEVRTVPARSNLVDLLGALDLDPRMVR